MHFNQIKDIVLRELGNVQVSDKGFLAPGIWGIQIIVGEKPNPAYDPIFNPQVDVLDRSRLPKMIPDNRTLKLNGMEDERNILIKLKPIKDTMNDFKKLPTFKEGMSGINADPLSNYMTAEEKGANLAIEKSMDEDPEYQAEIARQNKITEGIPEAPNKGNGFMDEILGALSDIGDRIGGIEKRLNNVEEVAKSSSMPTTSNTGKKHWKTIEKENKIKQNN